MAKKNEKKTAAPVEQETVETPKAEQPKEEKPQAESFTLSREEFDQVKAHIDALQKEKDETVALLQRNQADFDNFRRRNASVRTDSFEEGKRECIKALLPVLDNFDRATEHSEEGEKAWRDGVLLVYKQLLEALAKQGMTEIETDCKFDPNFHEAVMQEKSEGKESGDIVAVFQKGYRVNDRIIRHSMVKVAE